MGNDVINFPQTSQLRLISASFSFDTPAPADAI